MRKGLCGMHYRRLQRYGDPHTKLVATNKELREFFDKSITLDTDECTEWVYSGKKAGYGHIGHNGRVELVHRLALMETSGEPTVGKPHALHNCNNPKCFNPRHLRWGSHRENMHDMRAVGKLKIGENSNFAKLKAGDVLEIRRLYGTNRYTQKQLADMFGICFQNISLIVNRKSWGHLA